MHISLSHFCLIQTIQTLCLRKRCQGADVADLCLSTGKHGRTMHSRNNINLCCQRPDLCDCTAIRTFVIFENHLADGLFLILINSLSKNCQPVLIVSKLCFQFFSDLTDIFFSCLFVIGKYGNFHLFRSNDLLDCLKELLRNRTALIGVFFFSTLCYDGINEFNDLLVYFMCFEDCLNHFSFRDLFCSGLDHDNLFTGGSNGQLQVGNILLSQGRVYNELAIDHTDLSRCTGTVKRNVRNASGNRGTQHSNHFRIALGIYSHNQVVQSYIIAVILRKQRTHGTVDDTGGQDRMLACFSLSLIKATRNLSYSVHFLFIFHT